jgi:MOSC domain-containing protein YiiM
MQQSGRCGWLYRVVSAGKVSGDHPLELVTRNSDVSVAEAIGIAWHMPFDEEQYRRLLAVAGLSASWSKTMLTRISEGRLEDFNRRLLGR